MKKIFSLFFLVFSCVYLTNAQVNSKSSSAKSSVSATTAKKPDLLKFDVKSHDYGTITKGEKRTFTYTFTNISKENVDIDLANGCDCMTLDWTKSIIKPGGKGEVKVMVDSNKRDKGDDENDNINVILTNTDPKTKNPIIYQLGYHYLIK
ncbi:MAG TPA: DUF1573 domain-containing protein [Saprospiraceae bacterium]|nr:DUF1573 domain-containing protein [Saprospiraceae bacterium]